MKLPLTLALLAAVGASLAQSSRLNVEVHEFVPGQSADSAALKDKAVIDTRSYLEVRMRAAPSANAQPVAAISQLSGLHDSLSKAMTELKAVDASHLSPTELLDKIQPILLEIKDACNQTIVLAGRNPKDPNYELAKTLQRKYPPTGSLVETATAMASIAIEFLQEMKVSGDTTQVPVMLTLTQRAVVREGRTYGDSPIDLLNLSAADQALLTSMQSADLAAQAKAIVTAKLNDIKTNITNDLQPKVTAVKTALGTAHQDLQMALDKDMSDLNALTGDQVMQNPAQITTLIDRFVSDATLLNTAVTQDGPAIQAAVQSLLTAVKAEQDVLVSGVQSIIGALTNAQSLATVIDKSVDLIVGKETLIYRIGDPTSSALTMDLATTFGNNDSVRIQVVSKSAPNSTVGEDKEADLTLYAYKQGVNWVRTISFDYAKEDGSDSWHSAPAVNISFKDFGRNRFYNTYGSIGFGVSLFPVGVIQSGSNNTESAIGLSLSLLDDWVSVGYARNLTTNKGFPFIGIMVPFKF